MKLFFGKYKNISVHKLTQMNCFDMYAKLLKKKKRFVLPEIERI